MTEILRQSLVRLLYTLIGYLTFYTSFWERSDYLQDSMFSNIRSRQNDVDSQSQYDFIVIGAGTAGSVVAHRLSEKYNVLLLEDGGEPFPLCQIPNFSPFLLNYPAIDWMYKTIPQSHAGLSLIDQVSGWSAGKNLGGTSNIHFLVHSRGSPLDFDSWAKKVKDSQWNYENVLPFFKRSEDYHGEYEDSGYHGKGGPVRLEIPSGHKSADIYLKAVQEMGYTKTDINGNGFDKIYYPIKNGRRHGTFNAYIKPIRRRRSLTIHKFAHANKIILEGEKNEASGVEYKHHGQIVRAYANKEIVLSAGAVQSPKLLMLSGIGPKKDLESHNIEVKHDSPQVGQNLQDHISVYVGPFFVDAGSATAGFPIPTFKFDRDIRLQSFIDFYLRGSGYLTTSGLEAIGFVTVPTNDTTENDPNSNWPNIQYLFSGINTYNEITFRAFAKSLHIREDVLDKYYKHAIGREYFFVVTSLARPNQTGEIKLKSKNPHDQLHIDPKYLQNDEDLQTLISGIKNIIRIAETSPTLQKIGTKFTTEPFPGCENQEFRSDAYFECYVRQYAVTLHNPVGTASMGDENGSGVVDPELRVIGVRKLRVIDASVMPHIVVGNTAASTIMIGEKGSDLILSTYRESQNATTEAEVVEEKPEIQLDMKPIKDDEQDDQVQNIEEPHQTERIPLPVSTVSTTTTPTTTTTTTEETTNSSSSSTSTSTTSTTPQTEPTTTTTTTTSSTTETPSTTTESLLAFPVSSSGENERQKDSPLLDDCNNSTKYIYLDIDERIGIPKKSKKNKSRMRRQVKCPPPNQTDYAIDIRSDYANEELRGPQAS